jgi:hypothetical protein
MAKAKREQRPTSDTEPATQQVVSLLTSILSEVQTQVRSEARSDVRSDVQSNTSKPLGDSAEAAVELFREIGATLDLLPTTIGLTVAPTQLDQPGDVRLTWSSTEARTVSIEAEDPSGDPLPLLSPGEVLPVEGGSVVVRNVTGTTIFTATAKGPCSDAEAEATVVFGPFVP